MTTQKQDVILASDAPAPAFSFADLNRMAVAIAKSGLFGVKDADQALSLMMIAQAEGKHPALIARDYDIIQGRPAKKAEAILRDFQSTGGKVEWQEMTDKRAAALFSHPVSPKPVLIEWDQERAEKAGLTGKATWKQYPRQMLRARVISEGCRAIAPSATSGFYTPEEVREFDSAPAPIVTITQAVAGAVEAPAPETIESHTESMRTSISLPSLEAAFAAAWKSTKDPGTRATYKVTYDTVKAHIAEASAREFAEAKEFETAEVPL